LCFFAVAPAQAGVRLFRFLLLQELRKLRRSSRSSRSHAQEPACVHPLFVGWVERSDTHHSMRGIFHEIKTDIENIIANAGSKTMGIATLNPS
jgi:hypothetical protein